MMTSDFFSSRPNATPTIYAFASTHPALRIIKGSSSFV